MIENQIDLTVDDPFEPISVSGTNVNTTKGDCTICYSLIEEVVKMCPACSAIYCQGCINKLNKNECPSCRSYQPKTSFVRNRFAEDLIREMRL